MYSLSIDMNWIPMTLSEFEGHICCDERQKASQGPSATTGLFVNSESP